MTPGSVPPTEPHSAPTSAAGRRCRHCYRRFDEPGWFRICAPCRTVAIDCPDCGGDGYIYQRHPLYGSIHCPSPTVEQECLRCGRTGQVRPETVDAS